METPVIVTSILSVIGILVGIYVWDGKRIEAKIKVFFDAFLADRANKIEKQLDIMQADLLDGYIRTFIQDWEVNRLDGISLLWVDDKHERISKTVMSIESGLKINVAKVRGSEEALGLIIEDKVGQIRAVITNLTRNDEPEGIRLIVEINRRYPWLKCLLFTREDSLAPYISEINQRRIEVATTPSAIVTKLVRLLAPKTGELFLGPLEADYTGMVMVKPEAVHHAEKIKSEIVGQGLKIIAEKKVKPNSEQIQRLYGGLRLEVLEACIEFMTDDCHAFVVRADSGDVFEKLIRLTGEELDPAKCPPNTLRNRYGNKTPLTHKGSLYFRNGVHRTKNARESLEHIPIFGPWNINKTGN